MPHPWLLKLLLLIGLVLSKPDCTARRQPGTSSGSSPCAAIAPSKVAISTMHILSAILPRRKGVPAAMPNKDPNLPRNDVFLWCSVSMLIMKSACCCRRTQSVQAQRAAQPALVEMASASGLQLHKFIAAWADGQTSLTYLQAVVAEETTYAPTAS